MRRVFEKNNKNKNTQINNYLLSFTTTLMTRVIQMSPSNVHLTFKISDSTLKKAW